MEKELELERPSKVKTTPAPSPRGPGPIRPALRTLEKKNLELNNATKQLEERVKTLQQKSSVVRRGLPKTRATSAPPRELPPAPKMAPTQPRRGSISVASNVTSRIREREAEFQKQIHDRDDQISRLKERLKVLSKRLGEIKDGQKENNMSKLLSMDNGAELQSIIKQVTKERLQLERHLQIANDSLQRNNGIDLERVLSLEQTNHQLRQQLDSLDLLQQEHRLVEIQFKEKEEACKELMNSLRHKSAVCEDLEAQLAMVMEKNNELAMANSDLHQRVVKLQDVSAECENLKSTLSKVESEYSSAKTEVRSLSGKVRNLESVLDEMQKAADSRREIEKQHRDAMEKLKQKQEEVDSGSSHKHSNELIEQLEKKIEMLEKEKRLQNEKHTELILEMAELKKYGPDSIANSEIEPPTDNLEIDEIMAKLEQDNKFLADLEKQRAERGKSSSPGFQRNSSGITDSGFLSQGSLNGSSPNSRLGGGGMSQSVASLNGSANPAKGSALSGKHISQSSGNLSKLPGMSKADKINLLNGSKASNHRGLNHVNEESAFEERDGMIEIPGKGWCFVYIARYSYDPFQHSPNDSPEAELQLNAGDYILVWGDVDEDGFYDGEILDGRRGLVPSNFVEKLESDELVDFHQQVVLGLGDCDDSVCTSVPQDLDFLSSDETALETDPIRVRIRKSLAQSNDYFSASRKSNPNIPQYASCTDLDLTEDEAEDTSSALNRTPPPRQLTLEVQQSKALVIGWNPPNYPVQKLECYKIVVDGKEETTVKATDVELKAIVTSVDLSVMHRVSVKAISAITKRASNEASCTMVIGKDAPLAPTGLKATRITSTSCTVSWIPSNSNFMHAICVSNVEVKTVKPGVFRHTLAGLSPDTTYKITIRAKNIKAAPHVVGHHLEQLQNLSSVIEIKTQPQGLPEAPVDVEVTKGPREDTLLVSWLPVTINPSGTSNGAPVTGYTVFANGKRIKDIDSGTADHAVIEVGRTLIKTVTVRTKSNDILSKDSNPCLVPPSAMKIKSDSNEDDDSDSDRELIEKLNQTATISTFPRHQQLQQVQQPQQLVVGMSGYPELDSDIGPSELSDIAEEPEDGLTDHDDRDSLTPKNMTKANSPLFKANRNSMNNWAKPKGGLSLTSPSQFSAQPLTNIIPTSNASNGSSTTYFNNTFSPAIQIKPSSAQSHNKPSQEANTSDKIRIFVALFDYDPQTMSPNPDGIDEELPFREGQLIKIFGDKDADGFYWGEASNRSGFVPCNMVSEVQVDDDHVAEELFKEQNTPSNGKAVTSSKKGQAKASDRWGDTYDLGVAKQKLALYDYDPTELSPNVDSEVELSFRTGDLILVYGDMDDDGFFMGELKGKRGLVPSNFLTDVPPGYDPKQLLKIIGDNLDQPKAGGGHQPRVLGQAKRW